MGRIYYVIEFIMEEFIICYRIYYGKNLCSRIYNGRIYYVIEFIMGRIYVLEFIMEEFIML